MRATTIQTSTTQFTTGGANTSSSRNQIQKITNAGKVDNLHRGRTKLTRISRTRVVVVSSSSSGFSRRDDDDDEYNDHDVLGLRGGQTKRRGVGVVARMTSAADTSSSSSCTISQELANLEQEFRDMLDPDSDSKPRAADVRAMRSRINALKREVANGNGANIIQSQTKTRAPDAKEIARKELERLREEREILLKMRAQVEENERLKKKNSNKGIATSAANNVEPEHDNPVTTTTTQKPKPADERKARVAHMEAEKHKEAVDVATVVMDDEMKALLAKEEQARKEAEELEASRLMAEAEEAKYAAYLEESGDFMNTNSGIRSGINDPFLDRAFIVEKLESELLENLEMQSDLRAIEDIEDQLESQKKEAEEAKRAKDEAEAARQLAEAKQKAEEEEARLIVEKQQKEARANAEKKAQAQAEAERKAIEKQLRIEELAREEQAKADAAKAKADAEYAKAEQQAKKLQEKSEILNDDNIEHLRAKYEELARESEASPGAKRDWAEALKIAGDKVRCMEQHSHGQSPKNDALWTVSPATPVPGQSVTVSYCNQNTVLNGRPKVFAHFGTNQWSNGAEQFEMKARMSAVAGDSTVWFDLDVSVPSKAVILDFVFSDGNGAYDNNNRGDFHVPVAGANEMLERSRIESCIKIYAKLRLEREEEDRLEELRQAERTKLKKIAKVKAAELTAKQRAHVLFTIPEFPKAGEPFKLCYNPKNTNLKDATGVSVVGGWNRWNHEQALPITKLSPDPSCKADSQDYFSVELTSPKDAFMFDFVFCDQDGNNYDNRNRLDYHLPIAGGINSDGSKAAEKPMHVMSVAVEMAPIAKVGGLGDVVTSLSLAVEAEGHRVEVVLPKYDCMKYDLIDDLKEEKGFEWGGTYNHVYSGTVEGVKTFFIDPDNGMFKVGMVYGTDYLSIPMTDQERFGFFSKAALEWMLQSGRNPDIIHIHDWQTAPVAKFLAEDYAPYGLDNPKVIFTIHNLHYGQALIADAMNNCSIATTVSRTYAKEIAHEGCVNPNLHKLHGVVNGIDPDIWDPRNDKFLPQFFGEDEVIPGKAAARQALCSRSNLYNNPEVPMIGVVTRLTHQKGIHLIKRAIYRALERGCQVCLLGSAPDEKVQKEFEEMAHQLKQEHYNTAALHLFYDETMSHFIYSGADMILVPSMFEPCGLSQLIAMRYGTVPVVRRTGGLADTVFDVEYDHAKAAWEGMTPNGFSFDGTDEGSIDYALDRGIDMFYNDIDAFRKLQANCMSQDWSWNRPAIEYIELFHAARKA